MRGVGSLIPNFMAQLRQSDAGSFKRTHSIYAAAVTRELTAIALASLTRLNGMIAFGLRFRTPGPRRFCHR
jgi:hypothetical protein